MDKKSIVIISMITISILFSFIFFLNSSSTEKSRIKLNDDVFFEDEFDLINYFEQVDYSNIIIDNNSDSSIQERVATKTLTLRSNTVCNTVSEQSYCLNNLKSDVYITNVNSDKWVVLLHGFSCKGLDMYTWFGQIYEYLGYNIITPDLRGHGASGGEISWGYLDSLDVYDWIKDLNSSFSKYGVNVAPSTIIVQGHSMGAATTLQLATNPDIAAASGSAPYTKNLTQLKVKGFIDGAGFTSLSNIAAHVNQIQYASSSPVLNNVLDSIIGDYLIEEYKIGLTSNNYDKYSNIFSRGRKFPAGSKIVIVHASDDTVVPYSNVAKIVSNISPGILVHNWNVQGMGHNPISEGTYNSYAKLIYNFTKCVEDASCTSI